MGAASLEASVVDVLVAEPEESREVAEQREAEDRSEPATTVVPPAAAAAEAGSERPARPPIAVGPGPTAVPPKPAAAPAPKAQPVEPAPAKPAAKRPSRSISIFTRTWSGGSGKAAGSRRRDRT
jgi:hypothetical protein